MTYHKKAISALDSLVTALNARLSMANDDSLFRQDREMYRKDALHARDALYDAIIDYRAIGLISVEESLHYTHIANSVI